MNTKSLSTLLVTTTLVLPGAALATNGYQLIGVGAYQKSLGGAVTAAPGSAMTAVSNPAGMARVGSRADFSMEAFMPQRDVDFGALGGEVNESAVELYGVPAIGWTAPTSDGSDMYFGGGMYGTSGMGVDYAADVMMAGATPFHWDGYSNIAFWQMAPTLAWNVDSRLSVGASLNIDYQSVSFRQRTLKDTTGDGAGDTLASNFDLGRAASAFGYGITLGLLYDLNEQVTLGASYKSKQSFSDLEYQLAQGDITAYDMATDTSTPLPAGTYKLGLDFPQQLAFGVSVDATPKLRVSADVKWINWSETMDELSVEGPVMDVPMDPGWDDQTVYAIGIAYALNERVNLRAGYNYAKAPFDEEMVSRNLILPAVVESHYTVGGDYRINNHWQLAVHYMLAPEVSYTAPATDPNAPGAEISLSETSFGMNIGYSF